MGITAKCIRNFILGRREKKGSVTHPSAQAGKRSGATSLTAMPNARARWSCKRSTSTKPKSHKRNKSCDSVVASQQVLLSLEYEKGLDFIMPLPLIAAATKIQAVYRSYLAKRALRALRGLVKLQALARGYLVRKQMNWFLRSIHAIMAIQGRARIHRLLMAGGPPATVGRRSYKQSSAPDRHLKVEARENPGDENICQINEVIRSVSRRTDQAQARKMEEYGSSTKSKYNHLSVAQREYQLKLCSNPSALPYFDSSSETYDVEKQRYSSIVTGRDSRNYSEWPENKQPCVPILSECPDLFIYDSQITPNYMNNTKSFKAKARSHSEPRSRPSRTTDQKSMRSSSLRRKNNKDQHPWSISIYRTDILNNSRDFDSNNYSARTSNHQKSPIPFQLPSSLHRILHNKSRMNLCEG